MRQWEFLATLTWSYLKGERDVYWYITIFDDWVVKYEAELETEVEYTKQFKKLRKSIEYKVTLGIIQEMIDELDEDESIDFVKLEAALDEPGFQKVVEHYYRELLLLSPSDELRGPFDGA